MWEEEDGKDNLTDRLLELTKEYVLNAEKNVWAKELYFPLRKLLLNNAVHIIQLERDGMVIESDLFIGFKQFCFKLHGSTTDLEEAYLEELKNYFSPKIAQYLQQHGIRNYLMYAKKQVEQEETNILRYLNTHCKRNADLTVASVFVKSVLDEILSEMKTLLREENIELLKICHELVARLPDGPKPLLPVCEEYMQSVGLSLIQENAETIIKDAVKYTDSLIDLHNQFSKLVSDAFGDDAMLLASRDKAYQKVVNNTEVFTTEIPTSKLSGIRRVESRCPELLATQCDLLLRRTPVKRRLSADEIEARLQKVLLVLKYVNNKDIFMLFYKSNVMRRLLLELSADIDMEEQMVAYLRTAMMPVEQVNKLNIMFQDVKLSDDLNTEFKTYYRRVTKNLDTSATNPNTIKVMILTPCAWIVSPEQTSIISLPTELEDILSHIEKFYIDKHKGHSLKWQHYLSHGILVYTSDKGRYEFELTTYQMVVLYAWNDRFDAMLRLDDLSTATGLQHTEVRRALWSLCEDPKMKTQVLLYSPKVTQASEFTVDTEFRLNLNFSSDKNDRSHKRRFNFIGRLRLNQVANDDDETAGIIELRKLRTQEAIIKLMKSRQQMHHNEIYIESVELLRFQFLPSKRFVKEVLEWLIEQQYVTRLSSDKNIYTYQA